MSEPDLEGELDRLLARFGIKAKPPFEVEGEWDRGDLSSDLADIARRHGAEKNQEPTGTWVAHPEDWSWFIPFWSEIEALRYAVAEKVPVTFLEWGDRNVEPDLDQEEGPDQAEPELNSFVEPEVFEQAAPIHS